MVLERLRLDGRAAVVSGASGCLTRQVLFVDAGLTVHLWRRPAIG